MEKTTSQKIAGAFEIVGYLWLLPSLISLFYPLLILIVSVFTLQPVGIIFGLLSLLPFSLGMWLLVGYNRHSRGLMKERKKIFRLWYATMAFNWLFLAPAAYFYFQALFSEDGFRARDVVAVVVYSLLIFWWAAAIILSAVAVVSENRAAQKYR